MSGPGISSNQRDTLSRCDNARDLYHINPIPKNSHAKIHRSTFEGDTMVSIQQKLNRGGWERIRILNMRFLSEDRLLIIAQVGKNLFIAIIGKPSYFLFYTFPKWIFSKAFPPIQASFVSAWPVLQNLGKHIAKLLKNGKSLAQKPVVALQNAFRKGIDTLQKPFSLLRNSIDRGAAMLVKTLETVTTAILSAIHGLTRQASNVAQIALIPFLWAQPKAMKGVAHLKQAALVIGNIAKKVYELGRSTVTNVQAAMVKTAQLAIALLHPPLNFALEFVKGGINNLQIGWQKISAVAATITQAVMRTTQVCLQNITTRFQKLVSWSKPHFNRLKKLVKMIKEMGSKLFHKGKREILKLKAFIAKRITPICKAFTYSLLRIFRRLLYWLQHLLTKILMMAKRLLPKKWQFS